MKKISIIIFALIITGSLLIANDQTEVKDVVNKPISPFFRLRAFDLLWPNSQNEFLHFNIFIISFFVSNNICIKFINYVK